MLSSIKLFFENRLAITSIGTEKSEKNLQIASVAFLIEMAHMDNKVLPEERQKVIDLACKHYALTAEESANLLELAEEEVNKATDYYQFASLINKNYTLEQKILLIKYLWEIAFLDGHLDDQEEYLVRKVAGLLHVPHSTFVKMKINVADAATNNGQLE
jgi:uncharacterized tellurite resistance protein B-like protein